MKVEMHKKKVLIISEDGLLRNSVAFFIENGGHHIKQALDAQYAIDLIISEPFDLIITEMELSCLNGKDIISVIRHGIKSKVPILTIVNQGDEKCGLESLALGADRFISKPFHFSDMLSIIIRLLAVDETPNANNEISG